MDAKKEFNPFEVASKIEDLLVLSGASKKQKKEVLDLLSSRIGCRLVAVGVPLERRQATVAVTDSRVESKAPKGRTAPGKTKFNQDPEVKKCKALLDAVLKDIRDVKKSGVSEVPADLLKKKQEALDLLAGAKAAAGRTSFASHPEKKEQAPGPKEPAPVGRISFKEAALNQKA
jgi:hypothetical protein